MRAFVPKGWKRPIVTHDNRKELAGWRDAVAHAALRARSEGPYAMIHGAIRLTLEYKLPAPKSRPAELRTVRQRLEWTWPIRRPDLDKLERAVLDACKGILWVDDAQIVQVTKCKVYDVIPGLYVAVQPVEPALEPVAVG